MSLLNYFSAVNNVYSEFKSQTKYIESFLVPYLRELETKYNGSFDKVQLARIKNYYALLIPFFLCNNYKRLQNKRLSDGERKRATLYGILTPIGDDLFDKDKLETDSIYTITFYPEKYFGTTFNSKVVKEIQLELLNSIPHKKEYIESCKNVLDSQIETLKQNKIDITEEELEKITFTKGAYSHIIYHQILDDPANNEVKELLFFIGGMFQLGNDVFDFYKDLQDNIHTLATTCKDFVLLKKKYLEKVSTMNKMIRSLSYPKKNKTEFNILMNTLNARILVAFEHFIKLQVKYGNTAELKLLERKYLIVDMEKPVNILKWFVGINRLQKM